MQVAKLITQRTEVQPAPTEIYARPAASAAGGLARLSASPASAD
jgi:hypothetical protein